VTLSREQDRSCQDVYQKAYGGLGKAGMVSFIYILTCHCGVPHHDANILYVLWLENSCWQLSRFEHEMLKITKALDTLHLCYNPINSFQLDLAFPRLVSFKEVRDDTETG
jgi:hypothetical protein